MQNITKINFGFTMALILLTIVGALSYQSTHSVSKGSQIREHLRKSSLLLDSLESTVKDAETGQRGYLLTGKETYLLPFTKAESTIQGQLEGLQNSFEGQEDQLIRLGKLKSEIYLKISELKRTVLLKKTNRAKAALDIVLTDEGKNLMDKIRASIEDLRSVQNHKIQTQLEVEAKAEQLNRGIVALGTFLAFLLVSLETLYLNKEFRKRKAAETERDRFFTMSLDLLCIAGTDGYFKRVNPAFEAVLGFTAQELCSQPNIHFVHPDDVGVTQGAVHKLSAGNPVLSLENRYRCKDGSYRWLSWKSNQFGNLKFAAARDITEAKIQAETIIRSKMFLDSIIENLPVMVFIKDSRELRFIRLNRAGANLIGSPAENFIGKNDYDFFPKEQADSFIQKDREVLDSDQLVEIPEEEIQTKQGIRILHTRKIGIMGPDGSKYLLGISEDITKQKLTERQILQAKRTAEEASRVKGEFLANMSHEIRTPLNGIIGMTDLLNETTQTKIQARYTSIVQESGVALLNIINDILDFSKIEAGKMTLEVIEFNIVTVVEAQADLLSAKANKKGLSLMTFIAPEIPSKVRGDPSRLAQVLINLISNAIKFTEKGSIVVRVDLKPSKRKEIILCFSIQDTGIGLSKPEQDRLFQPFTQADGSTARKFGGTGLGLSICKRIVEKMNGKIEIESEINRGSIFSFTAQFDQAIQIQNLESLDLAKLANRRVLVVDDDPPAGEIISTYLRGWKMIPTLVSSPHEALKVALQEARQKRPYALAILDKKMPEMDGFELAKKLRGNSILGKMPLILVTAHRSKSDRAIAQTLFSSCLIKPLRQSELYNSIVSAFHRQKPLSLLKKNPGKKEVWLDEKRIRILVAEDHPVNQLLILTQLKSLGYVAQAVANGLEVVQTYQLGHFDLILMDCQMPEMDGFKATESIRQLELKNGRHIPIVALTANAMNSDKEACLECGMDDHISKPVKKDSLAKVIELWTTKRVPFKKLATR